MRRLGFLACLLLAGVFLAGRVWAQAAEPAHPAAQSAAGQPEAKPEPAHGKESAAAEHDEEAEFKQSASVQWLAKLTGLSTSGAYWLSTVLNFVLVAAFLVWVLRTPLTSFFRNRTAAIQKNMEEARRASEEAGRRLSEIEARLARLDAETAEMRAAAERDAVKEEEAARAAAEQAKTKIVRGAQEEIAAAGRAARGELKAYAAELAVSLAEKQIQVSPAADRALVKEFVEQLGKDS